MIDHLPHCRGCGRPILWAVHAGSGKRAPFDPRPSAEGEFVLQEQPDGTLIAVHDPKGSERYVSHFATCPKADEFRGRSKQTELGV